MKTLKIMLSFFLAIMLAILTVGCGKGNNLSAFHKHKYEAEIVPPTVSEKGYTLHICECGDSYTDSEKDPTGSQGLEYMCDPIDYIVHGIGSCQDTEIYIPSYVEGNKVIRINGHAFREQNKITKVVIPETVKKIGNRAFLNCTSLTSVSIPDTVHTIDSYAFSGCTALKDIVLPSSLKEIRDRLFENCQSLAEINIPSGVRYIDIEAFANCTNLKKITFQGTKEQWEGINKKNDWNKNVPATVVHCTDGDVAIQ